MRMRYILKRAIPLVYLIPISIILGQIFWAPLNYHFYNFFQSKRHTKFPWTNVTVIAIDDRTINSLWKPPVFPLSNHIRTHALITNMLDRAGAKAIVFDLQFCLLYTSPSPRDKRQSRMPSSA